MNQVPFFSDLFRVFTGCAYPEMLHDCSLSSLYHLDLYNPSNSQYHRGLCKGGTSHMFLSLTMEKVYLTALVLILVTGAIGQFMPLLRKHRKTLEMSFLMMRKYLPIGMRFKWAM